jgi:hypothetical protein
MQTAHKYHSLENNIRRQLSVCRSHRTEAAEYYEWVGEYFDTLESDSPLIPDSITEQVKNWAKQKQISFIIYDKQIMINEHSNSELDSTETPLEVIIHQ